MVLVGPPEDRRVIGRPEAPGAVGAHCPIPRVLWEPAALCRRRQGPKDDACRNALRRNVRPCRDFSFQAFGFRPSVGGPLTDGVWHLRATKISARNASQALVGSSRRLLWFLVP